MLLPYWLDYYHFDKFFPLLRWLLAKLSNLYVDVCIYSVEIARSGCALKLLYKLRMNFLSYIFVSHCATYSNGNLFNFFYFRWKSNDLDHLTIRNPTTHSKSSFSHWALLQRAQPCSLSPLAGFAYHALDIKKKEKKQRRGG